MKEEKNQPQTTHSFNNHMIIRKKSSIVFIMYINYCLSLSRRRRRCRSTTTTTKAPISRRERV